MARKKKVKVFNHNAELDLLSKYMKYYVGYLYKKATSKSGTIKKSDTFEDWKGKQKKKSTKQVKGKSIPKKTSKK